MIHTGTRDMKNGTQSAVGPSTSQYSNGSWQWRAHTTHTFRYCMPVIFMIPMQDIEHRHR
jgi:hypothetical protein